MDLGRRLMLPRPRIGESDACDSGRPGLDLPTVRAGRADQPALAGSITAIENADDGKASTLRRVKPPLKPGGWIFPKRDCCRAPGRQRDGLRGLRRDLSASRREPSQRQEDAKESGRELWEGKFCFRKHLCQL